MQPPPPPYQQLPPNWQTRTDANGKLLYISPDGQTHVAPPTAVTGPSAREADGAISADLFGGGAVPLAAQPSYMTPMAAPGISAPQSYTSLQPMQPMQPTLQSTTLGMPPIAQTPTSSDPLTLPIPSGVDNLMSLGFGRDTATAALRECAGSVERAANQLLATQQSTSIAPTPALPVNSGRVELDQLMAMGYSQADANAALDRNQSLQAAADWLAQGYRAQPSSMPGDVATNSSGSGIQPTLVTIEPPALHADDAQCDADVVRLQEMGYSRGDAVGALTANGGNLQQAVDWLVSGNIAPAPVSTPLVAAHDTLFPSSTAGGNSASYERTRRTSVDEIEKFFGGWGDISGDRGGDSGGDEGTAATVAFDDEFDPRAHDDMPRVTAVVGNAESTRQNTAVPTTTRWQWRCEAGWKDYTEANNAILERGYLAYQGNELGAVQREVDLENATHSVNFEEMKQFVKEQPWRKRDVRRQPSLESLVASHNRVLAELRRRGPGHFTFLDLQHEQQSLFARIQDQVASIGEEHVQVHAQDDGSLVVSGITLGTSSSIAASAGGATGDIAPQPAPDFDLLDGFFASEPTAAASAPPVGDTEAGQSLARQDSEGTQKKLQMRHHAIKELLATEQRYGEKLRLMDEGYFQPLSRRLPESDIRVIFSSFPAILQCQKKFYDDLAEAKERWEQQLGDGGTTTTSGVSGDGGIISVVERYTPFFKMYRPYVAGYPGALRKIDQIRADQRTAGALEECKQQLGRTAPALDMLLIEPVQRIPRYRLLLEEARKHTPTEMHADCAALDKAIEAIIEVAEGINENAREDDERQKVVEIHSRFKPPKDDDYQAQGALAALVQPRRRFVQSVAVQAAELDTFGKGTQEEDRLKPRQLLLFNDMLMLVKDKGDDKLSYKAHIDFDDQVNFSEVRGSDWLTIDGMGHHSDRMHGERPIHRMWKVKWETAGEMTKWETAVQKYAREVREVEESTRSRQRHYYKGGGGGAR